VGIGAVAAALTAMTWLGLEALDRGVALLLAVVPPACKQSIEAAIKIRDFISNRFG
jgi:hypothetical protein